jgi:hypothetical protein
MTVLPVSLGASMFIFSFDIVHDEKVIDQVTMSLLRPYLHSCSANFNCVKYKFYLHHLM